MSRTAKLSGTLLLCANSKCGKQYPVELGGKYCPKCEDLLLEVAEVMAEINNDLMSP